MKNYAKAEQPSHLLDIRDVFDISGRQYGLSSFNALCVIGMIFSLGSLFFLSSFTAFDKSWGVESATLLYLHSYAAPAVDQLALIVSGSVTVVAMIILLILIYHRSWRAAAFWLAATLGAQALADVAKHFFHHGRPQLWDVVSHQSSYAFPSGHATLSMSIALTLFVLYFSQARVLVQLLVSLAFVIAVGVSRMYLGLHFPTDILGGWLLATAWVCMLSLIFKNSDRSTGLRKAL